MHHHDLAPTVRGFGSMTPPERRRSFDQLVREAFTLTGGEFAQALDFNARLVTQLREQKIDLFRDELRP